jgi:hypothetical protein
MLLGIFMIAASVFLLLVGAFTIAVSKAEEFQDDK